MIVVKTSEQANCSFSHHIPATHKGIFERTNKIPHYYCDEHAQQVNKYLNRKAIK